MMIHLHPIIHSAVLYQPLTIVRARKAAIPDWGKVPVRSESRTYSTCWGCYSTYVLVRDKDNISTLAIVKSNLFCGVVVCKNVAASCDTNIYSLFSVLHLVSTSGSNVYESGSF